VELNEIIAQKCRHKKNQLMNKVQIYPEIQSSNLSKGQHGQTDMKIILNVVFKNAIKHSH